MLPLGGDGDGLQATAGQSSVAEQVGALSARQRGGVEGGVWLSSGCSLRRGVDLMWRVARGASELLT